MFFTRFESLCRAAGKTTTGVGGELGISKTTISYWRKTVGAIPKSDQLIKISNYFDVSIDYLFGKSDIARRDESMPQFDDVLKIGTKKIPLLGGITGGGPVYEEQDFEGYVDCGVKISADFALRCRGDSMVNARMLNGDAVLIREQSYVEDGEIAAVVIDGEPVLKRVYRKDGGLVLMAENAAYPPLVYTDSEVGQVKILGKAVAFQSEIV